MRMTDWITRLDAFLQFNEQEILQDKGQVSHAIAMALAEKWHLPEVVQVEQRDTRHGSHCARPRRQTPRGGHGRRSATTARTAFANASGLYAAARSAVDAATRAQVG